MKQKYPEILIGRYGTFWYFAVRAKADSILVKSDPVYRNENVARAAAGVFINDVVNSVIADAEI